MITQEQIDDLVTDGVVLDESGQKIGKVAQVYLDDESGRPAWISVTTGWFGTSTSVVPVAQAQVQGTEVRVPVSIDQVRQAPRLEADDHISHEQEVELSRHYGLSGGGDARGTGDDSDDTRETTAGSPVHGDVTRPYTEGPVV